MEYFDFEKKLNILFPQSNSLDGDKVGLQIKNTNIEVNKVLITLEVTEDVLSECKYLKIDTIISFHPLIYKDFSLADNNERVGVLVKEIIKSNLNLFVIHTNFDTFEYGTNYILAKKLNLNIVDYLLPLKKNKLGDTELGMGLICESFRLKNKENIGNFEDKFNLKDLLEKLDEVTNSPIKYCIGDSLNINKIAIICGSGSSFIDNIFEYNNNLFTKEIDVNNIINNKIDTFITSDLTYHNFHKCKGRLNLIDIGHFEMEQFVVSGLFDNLTKHFKNEKNENISINKIEFMDETIHLSNNINIDNVKNTIDNVMFYKSKVLTNPVEYYQQKNFKNYKENQLNYLLNH